MNEVQWKPHQERQDELTLIGLTTNSLYILSPEVQLVKKRLKEMGHGKLGPVGRPTFSYLDVVPVRAFSDLELYYKQSQWEDI